MAASRSCDIPMESCGSPCCSASSRRRAEIRAARLLRVVGPRRHSHQAQQPQVRARAQRPRSDAGKLVRAAAGLGLLGRELHFQHDVQAVAGFVQPSRQLGGIDGLDDVETSRRRAWLCWIANVRSGGSARRRQTASSRQLGFELLHVVLAELAQAQVVGFPHRRWRETSW